MSTSTSSTVHGTRFSAEELDAYERDGYVVRERAFSTDEVAEITEACERLVTTIAAQAKGNRAKAGSYVFEPHKELAMMLKWEGDTDVLHGLEPFAHVSPEMKRWALDPRFIDPMKDICQDEEAVLFTEKLNLKRPRVGGKNPMHQDYPYWIDVRDDPSSLATAMLFLDDATLENGCLQVLPGSHHLGVARMRTDADDFGNNEMDPTPFQDSTFVPLEVPAGSVAYFGPLLIHQSATNTSLLERRTLLFSYGPHDQRHMSELMAESMRHLP